MLIPKVFFFSGICRVEFKYNWTILRFSNSLIEIMWKHNPVGMPIPGLAHFYSTGVGNRRRPTFNWITSNFARERERQTRPGRQKMPQKSRTSGSHKFSKINPRPSILPLEKVSSTDGSGGCLVYGKVDFSQLRRHWGRRRWGYISIIERGFNPLFSYFSQFRSSDNIETDRNCNIERKALFARSVRANSGLNARSVCAIWAFFAHSLDYYAAFVNMKDKYIHCLCCA